jgi:hypothetical protein
MNLQPVPVGFEPAPHLGVFMVGGVVLNSVLSKTGPAGVSGR